MPKKNFDHLPPSMHPKTTGPRVLAARLALNVRPSELADKIGCDRSAWSKYEKGERPFPLEQALKVAEMYDIPTDFFYRGRLTGIEPDLRADIIQNLLD